VETLVVAKAVGRQLGTEVVALVAGVKGKEGRVLLHLRRHRQHLLQLLHSKQLLLLSIAFFLSDLLQRRLLVFPLHLPAFLLPREVLQPPYIFPLFLVRLYGEGREEIVRGFDGTPVRRWYVLDVNEGFQRELPELSDKTMSQQFLNASEI
jgi:hypothetical protein